MAARRDDPGNGGQGGRRASHLSGHARLVPRRAAPPAAPATLKDPRAAPLPRPFNVAEARLGRRAALVVAATGALWVVLTAAGDAYGWPTRARAFFDLLALAGFSVALYLTWQAWRLRRTRGR